MQNSRCFTYFSLYFKKCLTKQNLYVILCKVFCFTGDEMNKKDKKIEASNLQDIKSSGNISLGFLLDFYGELLTPRQRELSEYYYNDDLSLSEISELTGLTRQGVRASIEKSRSLLLNYENKLGLCDKFLSLRNESENIINEVKRLTADGYIVPTELYAAVNRLKELYE